jgi:hypothetical protein
MQNPEWRARYRKRVGELLPLFAPATKLRKRVEFLQKRLRPVLAAIDPEAVRNHSDRVNEFMDRLTARAQNLQEQNAQPDPGPAEFDENGMLAVTDWYPVSESEDADVKEIELSPDQKAYAIICGPSGQCVASWRRKVLLAKGRYGFRARVQTKNVAAIDDPKGSAAGLRISGSERTNSLSGTSKWRDLEFEFSVAEEKREVELVAELRTTRGHAWFEVGSLVLVRKPVDESK